MKAYFIMPNSIGALQESLSDFISCIEGDEAPPKGDFAALQGYAEAGNIFWYRLKSSVIGWKWFCGHQRLRCWKPCLNKRLTLRCSEPSDPEKMFFIMRFHGWIFCFILFFLVFNDFNNRIKTVLMDGRMLYTWEKILCQEYFSGMKFFEHKFKFRHFIVRQDIKIRRSGFALIYPLCNAVCVNELQIFVGST